MSSWQGLTIRLKQEIVELLDYESRCNLRLCSSSDRDTVDSTKIIGKELKISETTSEMAEGKTIIRLDIDTFTIWFIGRENLTRIDRGWNGEIIEGFSETRQQNRYELIGEFMERFTRKGFVWVNTIDVDSTNFSVPETWNIKCANLKLYNLQEHYLGWLRKFVTLFQKLKKLEIGCWGNEPEISELLAQIKVTKTMKVDHYLNFTDEQLDQVEAMDLKIYSFNVTAEAIKKRLQKFLKYGGKGDELDLHTPSHELVITHEQLIPNELIVKRIRMQNEEETEYNGHIIGGFENVHGVQDRRFINYIDFGQVIRIHCRIYEKPERSDCIMYPF
ncbi:hypothetical protein CAEBREN_29082 [Caenorhabditis brenneri]|uniref:F-box domain-containing protein n=1 Tax=Caenorhabditis brenneri TaxID=135651 RepID=G0NMJ8_CAEBE|nr:hypothetical protein CAEBREN_29082 [Caenorhabditis brenneri]